MTPIEHIPFDKEAKRFESHLKDPETERVIFSGIFGIGKTYFIRKFFEANKDAFDTIIISPVNYSVSSSEDIFELIKFDILFQLLDGNIDYEKFQLDYFMAADLYLRENYKSILLDFVKGIPKIGRNVFDLAPPIKRLIEILEKPIESAISGIEETKKASKIDDKGQAKNFLELLVNKKGTPVELDMTSQLINKLLLTHSKNEIEEDPSNSNRKYVLVIDDIDRVDPEHIFRIFNIFSAHFDHYGYHGQNKFEFEKVILVCDIKNIMSVFYHRYGHNADFTGYIDKFYSTEIFHYDFAGIVKRHLEKFLLTIETNNGTLRNALTNRDSQIKTDLEMIMGHLVVSGSLSLRGILKFLNTKLLFTDISFRLPQRQQIIHPFKIPIFVEIFILDKLFNGKQNLIRALDNLITYIPIVKFSGSYNFVDNRIGSLIQLVDYKNNLLEPTSKEIEYESTDYNIRLTYEIHPISGEFASYGKLMDIGPANKIVDTDEMGLLNGFTFPVYQFLKLAVTNYYELVNFTE